MRRINEVLREVIGAAIASELEDPRIGFVTVTAVETSPDLRSARVYVSVLGDEDGARGDARRRCAPRTACSRRRSPREMRMKRTPTLTLPLRRHASSAAMRLTQLLEDE